MRTTISEIAARAGLSTATVDRVLNDRGGVKDRTCDIVRQVAAELGYFGPAAHVDPAEIRLDIVLPAGANSFMRELRQNLIRECAHREDLRLRIHDVDDPDQGIIEKRLAELRGQTDAVGVVVPDRPEIRETLNMLAGSGVKVATLVSDIPLINKVGYVGVDNRASGRTAGLLLGRLMGQSQHRNIALFVGSRAYRGHEEREMGFRSILAEEFPDMRISAYAELGDDRVRAYQEMTAILQSGPIGGIYNIGSGNQGIAQALREAHLARDTVFVGHDLTDASRILLLDRTMDAVIDQNPRVEAREAVRMLSSAVRGGAEPEYLPRVQIILRENIPTD
ncbi:MAG: substrate-binding domain-containing protein [Paracoccus denitrificans]|uniref:Substrate-binding domain-containing protein n=1 Tax=Paracoccus denitrificans TaxID=266 RepID=A0A533I9A6_PARDE|nr:MAG: substrate-binding domain-containing protein [Paracoccus denitrificans]